LAVLQRTIKYYVLPHGKRRTQFEIVYAIKTVNFCIEKKNHFIIKLTISKLSRFRRAVIYSAFGDIEEDAMFKRTQSNNKLNSRITQTNQIKKDVAFFERHYTQFGQQKWLLSSI